jgi:hypothetical protein
MYPIALFPSLWEKFDRLISESQMIAPEEVLFELEKKEDGLFGWAKDRPQLFRPLNAEVQNAVREILANFPKLVDSRKDRSRADPFVIALAMVTENGVVVTGEKNSGVPDKPRIPNVCEYFGIPYLRTLELIQRQGWKF